VSVLAPVGAALLGLAEGQSIDWPTLAGVTRLTVLKSPTSLKQLAICTANTAKNSQSTDRLFSIHYPIFTSSAESSAPA
jgi:hypothetical protein